MKQLGEIAQAPLPMAGTLDELNETLRSSIPLTLNPLSHGLGQGRKLTFEEEGFRSCTGAMVRTTRSVISLTRIGKWVEAIARIAVLSRLSLLPRLPLLSRLSFLSRLPLLSRLPPVAPVAPVVVVVLAAAAAAFVVVLCCSL